MGHPGRGKALTLRYTGRVWVTQQALEARAHCVRTPLGRGLCLRAVCGFPPLEARNSSFQGKKRGSCTRIPLSSPVTSGETNALVLSQESHNKMGKDPGFLPRVRAPSRTLKNLPYTPQGSRAEALPWPEPDSSRPWQEGRPAASLGAQRIPPLVRLYSDWLPKEERGEGLPKHASVLPRCSW